MAPSWITRVLTCVLVYTTAGAVTTVLVAWGCTLACPKLSISFFSSLGHYSSIPDGRQLYAVSAREAPAPAVWSTEVVEVFACSCRGVTEMGIWPSPMPDPGVEQRVVRAGIPLRALQCEV